ncbi:hypothetical protein [Actinotignum schaalii]|nr:hypothetical protein [Actinotignum schaalii]MDE1536080.1 hypothetical protein [Actinotignum schaalii]
MKATSRDTGEPFFDDDAPARVLTFAALTGPGHPEPYSLCP